MPQKILDAIKFGHERYVLADAVVRLTEEFRADYIPGVKTWEAFALLLILRKMLDQQMNARMSNASTLSRAVGMPRTTVQRRLVQLKQIGAIVQHGSRYAVVPEFMNVPQRVEGFKRRREVWHRADKKMTTVGT